MFEYGIILTLGSSRETFTCDTARDSKPGIVRKCWMTAGQANSFVMEGRVILLESQASLLTIF